MEELQSELADETPVWAIFGDLMSALVGVFVLILVWVLAYQVELAHSLEKEVIRREAEQDRRMVLEQALEALEKYQVAPFHSSLCCLLPLTGEFFLK